MMINPTDPMNDFSPFLPSTYNIPEEDDRLKVFLVDTFSQNADVTNDKKIGIYVTETENFDGEKWWYKSTRVTRNGYQTFVYISSYPNTSTMTLTLTSSPAFPIQEIDNEFVITNLWGTASKPPITPDTAVGTGDYFSFLNEGNSKISFTMTSKRIVITTTTDLSAYSGFIVIQYLRNGV